MASSAGFGQRAPDHAGSSDHAVEKVKVLNSWKEIAAYLGRGVRTVQRWEADLGLPVRRPRGTDRSAVVAIPADIDEWLKQSPVRGARQLRDPQKQSSRQSTFSANQERWAAMLKETRQLLRSVRESRGELRDAVAALSQSITQIRWNKEAARSVPPPSNLTTIGEP